MFNDLMDSTLTHSSDDELQHYLSTDAEDVKDDLMWWHERRATFLCLSHMAHDYLAIPGELLTFLRLYEVAEVLNVESHSHKR
jgi:hypothetical protein